MVSVLVVAFYKFVKLTDPKLLQAQLKSLCQEQEILGTVLLATEGINGTVAGKRDAIKTLITFLKAIPEFSDLEGKYSVSTFQPFDKLKILFKNEIVALKVPGIDPTQKSGVYVESEDWNDLISKEDVLVLDTRNGYEVAFGTFKGAVDPNTRHFRDFPTYVKTQLDPAKHKKVAMFCTGGIRCEKASSYLLEQGFENVYQLHGGILKYLEQIPTEKSLWEGNCFIFDNRITLDKENILRDNTIETKF